MSLYLKDKDEKVQKQVKGECLGGFKDSQFFSQMIGNRDIRL